MTTYKLDNFSYHEVLDRAYVSLDHFNDYVADHPAVQNNKELAELAEEVTAIMYKFYNLAALYSEKDWLADERGLKRTEEYNENYDSKIEWLPSIKSMRELEQYKNLKSEIQYMCLLEEREGNKIRQRFVMRDSFNDKWRIIPELEDYDIAKYLGL